MGPLTLKYFSGENWGRALWLFVQAIALSIGLLILHHIIWVEFLIYIIGAFGLGWIYKDWKQTIGDFVTGSYLGLLVFIVR
jgi:hypothetical protein